MTRSRGLAPAVLATVVVAVLVALGVWQLERREWKHALIAQVSARLAAPPVPAPGPGRWPRIGRDDAYTRVSATGRFRAGADTLVQATTELGGGFWVLTPLDLDGWSVLVNRGFVPPQARGAVQAPAGPVTVTGLLRVSEPGGGFLRTNDPAADRWYSRDVAAIAARRGMARAAPYFIDRSDGPRTGWPRAGLTVVRFNDNHLVYALTWFGLAGLVAVMFVRSRRAE